MSEILEVDNVVWYKSVRVWSAIVTVLSLAAYLFGVGPILTPDEVAEYVDYVIAAIGTISTIIAIIGQFKSDKKIVLFK